MQNIFTFSAKDFTNDEDMLIKMGIRGKRLMKLASLELPILPGFVVSNSYLSSDEDESYLDALHHIGSFIDKNFDSKKDPLLVKIVVSPMLNVPVPYSSIHNIGLCDNTLEGFSDKVGSDFAYHEYRNLIAQILRLKNMTEEKKTEISKNEKLMDALKKAKTIAASKKAIDAVRGSALPEDIFTDGLSQFELVVKLFADYFKTNEVIGDSALIIQAMTFGNYGKESFFGQFYTRDIISGKNEISGEYFENSFDNTKSEGKPVLKIKTKYLADLKKFAKILENYYKEIRSIKFTVEDGRLWVIDQGSSPEKSAQAEIKTLLDLLADKVVEKEYVISTIKPGRLSEILHPVLDKKSAKGIPVIQGGITGAVGAAIGRVFFSTDRLINEYRIAVQNGEDQNLILAMPATYAEDVKAIEVAKGVLTNEGGYASHAPVVARSLGKVAMVRPDVVFQKGAMKIGGKVVKEGDYISLDVPSYDEPCVYLDKLELIEPNIKESGIIDFLDIVQDFIGDFDVHANADQPTDAELAKLFKAKGIGLCRTEHMFFNEKRIPIFRSMILADDLKERNAILKKLKVMQTNDFFKLFKIMNGHDVTIRLLDSPLHEFLPQSDDSMAEFIKYMKSQDPKIKPQDIKDRCLLLREVNPMLGHRGVRLSISYPEIYKMQIEAIFEAAYKLFMTENIITKPEIMIPIVMTDREVKTVRFGKNIEGTGIEGIDEIEKGIRKKLKAKPLPYKVGTMVELPAAAVQADKIARYADFFSFGTNDLTQTTCGLSRDDFNSFFTDYNEFDLLERNPFQFLGEPVKEIMRIAVERGRLTRPDLRIGLCGEHGAEPANIPFCMDLGLNYVSCSPYGIPLAKLTIAQINLQQKNKKK